MSLEKSVSHDIVGETCSDEKNEPPDDETENMNKMIQIVNQKLSLNLIIMNYLMKALYTKKIGFWWIMQEVCSQKIEFLLRKLLLMRLSQRLLKSV